MVVGLPPADLRGEVVRRPDGRSRQVQRVRQRLRDAEISDLDQLLGGDEYVLGLEVPVENVLLVDILEGEGDLYEPAEDVRLGQELLQLLLLPLDEDGQVSGVGELHDDEDPLRGLAPLDDIGTGVPGALGELETRRVKYLTMLTWLQLAKMLTSFILWSFSLSAQVPVVISFITYDLQCN